MEAILEGKLDDADLTSAERTLLDYVKLVTQDAPRTTPEDVQNSATPAGRKTRSPKACTSRLSSLFSTAWLTHSECLRRTI